MRPGGLRGGWGGDSCSESSQLEGGKSAHAQIQQATPHEKHGEAARTHCQVTTYIPDIDHQNNQSFHLMQFLEPGGIESDAKPCDFGRGKPRLRLRLQVKILALIFVIILMIILVLIFVIILMIILVLIVVLILVIMVALILVI